MMLKKKEKVVRSNTRITPDQSKFVKELADKTGHSEGEIFREIIQFYIDNHKKQDGNIL